MIVRGLLLSTTLISLIAGGWKKSMKSINVEGGKKSISVSPRLLERWEYMELQHDVETWQRP